MHSTPRVLITRTSSDELIDELTSRISRPASVRRFGLADAREKLAALTGPSDFLIVPVQHRRLNREARAELARLIDAALDGPDSGAPVNTYLISEDDNLNTDASLVDLAGRNDAFRFFMVPRSRGLEQGLDLRLPPELVDDWTDPSGVAKDKLRWVIVDQRTCADRLGLGALISRFLARERINVEALTLEASGSLATITLKAVPPSSDEQVEGGDARGDHAPIPWSSEDVRRCEAEFRRRMDRIAPPLGNLMLLDDRSEELEVTRGLDTSKRKGKGAVLVGWWKWQEIPFAYGQLAQITPVLTAAGVRIRRVEVQTLYISGTGGSQNIELTAEFKAAARSRLEEVTGELEERMGIRPTFKVIGEK